MDNINKDEVILWLNTHVNDNRIIYDYILDIKDMILSDLSSNNMRLRYDDDIFTINLVYYLYNNSYTHLSI
jgi:hypothetical protein